MGIFFHPFTIENFLKLVYSDYTFTTSDVFEHQGIFRCFDAHSKLASMSANDLVAELNQVISTTKANFKKTDFIWISLGTSFVYKHKSLDKYVANCHQLPNHFFHKELSSVEEIYASLYKSVDYLRSLQPGIQIGFTVSPVRHIRDGIIENTRSKSHLHTALHQLLEEDQMLNYFPAYEIFQDELRDYRYYASDLVHPNQLGIDYIWSKFKSSLINESCFDLMKKIDQLNKGNTHQSRFPETEAHQKFLGFQKKLRAEIDAEKFAFKKKRK